MNVIKTSFDVLQKKINNFFYHQNRAIMFSQRRKRPAAQLIASGAKRPRPSKSSMYSHGRAVFCRGDHKADNHKQWAALGAWFLGPKAENGGVLRDLLTQAVDAQIGFRHR